MNSRFQANVNFASFYLVLLHTTVHYRVAMVRENARRSGAWFAIDAIGHDRSSSLKSLGGNPVRGRLPPWALSGTTSYGRRPDFSRVTSCLVFALFSSDGASA